MRRKRWIKELISQIVIIGMLAVMLYYIFRLLKTNPDLSELVWLQNIFYIAVAVFATIILHFLRHLFSSYTLERFDPGSPESLQRLSGLRRFILPASCRNMQENWAEPVDDIRDYYLNKDYYSIENEFFDYILEREQLLFSPWRGRRFYKRVFIFYHPILNVLIVDQKLKQAERWLDQRWDKAASKRNLLIFVTDMKNFDEVSSAGAGVVNFLGDIRERSLYPVLIDLSGGRYFFPLDLSLLKRYDRIVYRYYRRRLKRLILQSSKTTDINL